MKKIEVENYISNYISKNNISFTDKLKKTKKINSVTELRTFFDSNFQLYKGKI